MVRGRLAQNLNCELVLEYRTPGTQGCCAASWCRLMPCMWEVSSSHQQQVLWILLRNVGSSTGTAFAVAAGATSANKNTNNGTSNNYGLALYRPYIGATLREDRHLPKVVDHGAAAGKDCYQE